MCGVWAVFEYQLYTVGYARQISINIRLFKLVNGILNCSPWTWVIKPVLNIEFFQCDFMQSSLCLIIEHLMTAIYLQTAGSGSSGGMPKMVLVDVDGVHMWYPSSLIVVQASDDLLLRLDSSRFWECFWNFVFWVSLCHCLRFFKIFLRTLLFSNID